MVLISEHTNFHNLFFTKRPELAPRNIGVNHPRPCFNVNTNRVCSSEVKHHRHNSVH